MRIIYSLFYSLVVANFVVVICAYCSVIMEHHCRYNQEATRSNLSTLFHYYIVDVYCWRRLRYDIIDYRCKFSRCLDPRTFIYILVLKESIFVYQEEIITKTSQRPVNVINHILSMRANNTTLLFFPILSLKSPIKITPFLHSFYAFSWIGHQKIYVCTRHWNHH